MSRQQPLNTVSRDTVIAHLPVPKRIANEQSEAIRIAMESGDRFRAIAAVEYAFELARFESGKMTSDTTIQVAFEIRIANVLESIGCKTISDVEKITPEQLELLPNVSCSTIQKIQQTMVEHGFSLARLV